MIDLSVAFKHPWQGFTCFPCEAGIQVSLRRGGAYAVGIGDTFEEAWANALHNGGVKSSDSPTKLKPRRDLDDLL